MMHGQKNIITEYVCTSLKLLNYLKCWHKTIGYSLHMSLRILCCYCTYYKLDLIVFPRNRSTRAYIPMLTKQGYIHK